MFEERDVRSDGESCLGEFACLIYELARIGAAHIALEWDGKRIR
jgi:hypothetical protein